MPDIDDALVRIIENGGKVLKSRTAIGPYGFIGHFEDCEGNGVALHSFA
jgi:predicted enzyme related to lactoylglutathione lyase